MDGVFYCSQIKTNNIVKGPCKMFWLLSYHFTVSISDKLYLHFKALISPSAFHMSAAFKIHYLDLGGNKIKVVIFLVSGL